MEDHFDTTPHFIQSLSAEVKEGFDAIWTNASLKEDDKVIREIFLNDTLHVTLRSAYVDQ